MGSSEKNTPVTGDVGRDGAGRWTGSGNPGGRPRKGDALSDAIRRKADPDELADIALTIARTSKQEAMRLQALGWLRDSGYRRPAERHELAFEQASTPERDWSSVPIEERRELLARLHAVPALAAQGDGSDNRRSSSEGDGDGAAEVQPTTETAP